jgi:hypothetical protein
MAALQGTILASRIVPSDSLDTYATHDEKYGRGGYRSVDTLEDRDTIPEPRRKEGMKVYVVSIDTEYYLKGGILNSNWAEPIGGAGSSRSTIVKIIEDYEALPNNGIILVDCTLGDITITLPILDDGESTYKATIKKIDGSSNIVKVINPVGAIDGYADKEIQFKNSSLTLVSLDNEFYII